MNRGSLTYSIHAYALVHEYAYFPRKARGMQVIFAVRVKSREIMVDQATNLSSSWSKCVFLSVVWLGNTI